MTASVEILMYNVNLWNLKVMIFFKVFNHNVFLITALLTDFFGYF